MTIYNTGSTTTTNLTRNIPDFIVDSIALDKENPTGETYWYFSEAQQNYGYYFKIAEINNAVNKIATWAFGKGFETEDLDLKEQLEHISGMGSDTFETIIYNQEITCLVVGDAFTEIVYNKKRDVILNMIPISPERVRLVVKNNRLLRYDVWNGKKWRKIKRENMWHSINNRIGDQIHGTSQIDACKSIIDQHNAALETNRIIELRSRALGIAYYKTDNEGKINYINDQIANAVKNGEMLGLPEDTVKIDDFPLKSLNERLPMLQYTENFFYQTFGVPRAIATSDGTSEVGGKMGHVIFEPIYSWEQRKREKELWNQHGIKLTFNRPPSLGGLVAETEAKNTGQLNIQPNDVTADLNRE